MLHVGGEPYEVVSRLSQSMPKEPKDRAAIVPAFELPGTPRDYKTRLALGVSGGGCFFANDQLEHHSQRPGGRSRDMVEIKRYKKFGPLRPNVTTLGFGISF
jgi:hypothetical protein